MVLAALPPKPSPLYRVLPVIARTTKEDEAISSNMQPFFVNHGCDEAISSNMKPVIAKR
jgi:hypothetical protein